MNQLEKMIEDRATQLELIYKKIRNYVDLKMPGECKCGPGCWVCCKLPVTCTILDGIAIANYLLKNGMVNDNLKHDLLGAHHRWNKSDSKKNKCVFLTKFNSCSIYPVRPVNCATYGTCNPPENCALDRDIKFWNVEADRKMINDNDEKMCNFLWLCSKHLTLPGAVLEGLNILKEKEKCLITLL